MKFLGETEEIPGTKVFFCKKIKNKLQKGNHYAPGCKSEKYDSIQDCFLIKEKTYMYIYISFFFYKNIEINYKH